MPGLGNQSCRYINVKQVVWSGTHSKYILQMKIYMANTWRDISTTKAIDVLGIFAIEYNCGIGLLVCRLSRWLIFMAHIIYSDLWSTVTRENGRVSCNFRAPGKTQNQLSYTERHYSVPAHKKTHTNIFNWQTK